MRTTIPLAPEPNFEHSDTIPTVPWIRVSGTGALPGSPTPAVDTEIVWAVAIQPDGKIVLAGHGAGTSEFGAVARLNSDGSPDVSFGTNGKVTFTFNGRERPFVRAVAVQSNGRIVVGGTSKSKSMGLVRFMPNGALDTSFNGTGKFNLSIADGTTVTSIALQTDAKIVAAGAKGAARGQPAGFLVIRLRSDGTLDPLFGSAGQAYTDFGDTLANIRAVAIDSTGRIVTAGTSYLATTPYAWHYALARYTAAGQLDPTFGTSGKVKIVSHQTSMITGVAIQPDGKIVGAGRHQEPGLDVDVAIIAI